MSADLIERARSWIEGDPDPRTRAELEQLLDVGDHTELRDRMEGSLEFGTAGIRGEVAAGPNRMNRAVIIRTTRGLAEHLIAESEGPPASPVIVGYDARPSSREFAEDTAGVLAAAGIAVRYFSRPSPTPLVAFACRHLGAAAAVVVTASHNPPADNGYKVFAGNGAQIVPPADHHIAEAIRGVGRACDVPRLEQPFQSSSPRVSEVPTGLIDDYWDQVNRNRPRPVASSLKIVYTPLHGVGGSMVAELFRRAGHINLIPVPEQMEPDGTFPTVTFPNPEEKGSLDLAVALAASEGAALVLANDPDADRLGAVVPVGGGWRPLTGNEIGVLLGDFVLRHRRGGRRPIVINSIVSSPMLGQLAQSHDAHFERTLTGFKWIANAAIALEDAGVGDFVFGYEEALGYTIGTTVRDKDGMSAALVLADLAATLDDRGEGLLDRLAELWDEAGVWASAQHSITVPGEAGLEAMTEAIEAIATQPPSLVGATPVTGVADYRQGADERPPWLGRQSLIELALGDTGRVLVRPSGTEPKLKIYVDLTAPPETDIITQQRRLQESAVAMAASFQEIVAI